MLNFFVAALLALAIAACDPCRDLGEQICICNHKDSEALQTECKAELNQAKSHKFFDKARDANICQEALKKCTCPDFINGQDEQCGLYRHSL